MDVADRRSLDVALAKLPSENSFSANEAGKSATLLLRSAVTVTGPIERNAEFPTWFHLGFCLASESEVLALHRKAVEGKANIVRELLAEAGEYAAFYLTDPDGRRIEVSWHAN